MNRIRVAPIRARAHILHLVVLLAAALAAQIAAAQSPAYGGPAPYSPLVDTRSGGVLEESYDYQRGGQAPGLISPATGWYHYGFPVSTYRWGWFGVQYRPRMVHHTGAHGDYTQTGFRWGY